jgi:hypothetical protein
MTTAADFPRVRAFREMQEQSRMLEQIQVVFIVGPPKCGTTWVQTTMNGHPEAVAMGEGHLATRLLSRLSEAIRAFNADQGAHAAESRQEASLALQLDDADRYLLVRQAIDRILIHYLRAAAHSGKRFIRAVLDKTPDHARHVGALSMLYPWAKFICVTRDVRDAAVSAWHHRELLGINKHATPDDLAPAFANDVWGPMVRIARHAAAALAPGHYTEIRYEDYKVDAAREVRRLLEFVGLDASEGSVQACVEAGDFKRQTRGREAGVEARSYHRKGVVGDWTNHLSPEVAERTLHIAEEILNRPIAAATMEAKPVASDARAAG